MDNQGSLAISSRSQQTIMEKIVRLVGWLTILRATLNFARFLRRNFLLRKQNLRLKYGLSDSAKAPWAVVTGASSGIGESFAKHLAEQGFNLVLIARRAEILQQMSKDLEKQFNVQVAYISFDFLDALENAQVLMDEVNEITQGDVAVVIHMAGNSDLSEHFTDRSLQRNAHVARLQVEGTLVVLQEFSKLMCKRSARSAIITSGALPAYEPLPGFAVASGTKSFIRSLSIAASYEFKDKIDIMCAHPIAVTSGILKTSASVILSSDDFVGQVLREIGYIQETNGSWLHDIIMALLTSLPRSTFQLFGWAAVPLWAKLLHRTVDLRPLGEKLANPKAD